MYFANRFNSAGGPIGKPIARSDASIAKRSQALLPAAIVLVGH